MKVVCLTDPIAFPRFSAPTVSKHKANPVVHTTAALIPCNTLATSRTLMVRPSNSKRVDRINAASPARNGRRLVPSLSVTMPIKGETTVDAPAYAASRLET